MQIKFLTMFNAFGEYEINKSFAQIDLLAQWQRSIHTCNIKFIDRASIEFKDYDFSDYEDKARVKKEIKNAYKYKDFVFDGVLYGDLESLYNALAEQKRLMELTITVEDYY